MSAKYYNQLKMLYSKKMITIEGLRKAVEDGNLTKEEFKKIMGVEY